MLSDICVKLSMPNQVTSPLLELRTSHPLQIQSCTHSDPFWVSGVLVCLGVSLADHMPMSPHLFGPFHDLVFSESLKHLLEEDAELLLDQGNGDLRDRQSGHLSDDVSHSAGALHYHAGRAIGDGVVDGLPNRNQV